MSLKTSLTVILASIVVSAGIFCAGYLAGNGIYRSRIDDRFVTVKGLSERDVTADLALWNIKLSSTGDDLTSVQNKIDGDRKELLAFLSANKILPEEIQEGQFNATDLMSERYRTERADQSRFIINYNLTVRSTDVAKVKEAAGKSGELLKKGLALIDNIGPTYIFTKLNEIKPEMIAEATKNARKAAEQFAVDSGSSVGPIRHASQGVFSISAKNALDADAPYSDGQYAGNREALEIEKKVRVVSTIEYSLKK